MSQRTCKLCGRIYANALGFHGRICKRCRNPKSAADILDSLGILPPEEVAAIRDQARRDIAAYESKRRSRPDFA